MIFKADNVLSAPVLREMLRLRQRVESLDHGGMRWGDVCLRIPVIKKPKCFDPSKFSLYDYFFGRRRRRRETEWSGWDEEEDDGFFDDADNDTATIIENTLQTDECANIKIPDLSRFSFTELASIKMKMEQEGFSLALGKSFFQKYHFNIPMISAEEVSRKFYPEPYCQFVQSAPSVCMEDSILELFAEDGEFETGVFSVLSDEEILEVVNTRNKSGLFNMEKDFSKVLSEISYNSTGHIVGAGVATITWVAKVNLEALKKFGSVQRGEALDKFTSEFESGMIKVRKV